MKIAVINGPNLNLLGKREAHIYGSKSMSDLEGELKNLAEANQCQLLFFQSNHEGELVDFIQKLLADETCQAIIINPAAFTHTSIALRDALIACEKPFIEVHLSNVHSREEFRKKSYLSDRAVGVITGLGSMGYLAALRYFLAKGVES